MSFIIELVEIGISLILLLIIGRYILYTKNILTLFIPSFILKFVFLAIAISIVQYIISRKDD